MAAALIYVPGWMPRSSRDGNTCVNELYFYRNDGTQTLKDVYSAADLATPLPNPVVSNPSGVFPQIWADSAEVFTVGGKSRESDPQTETLRNVQPSIDVIDGPVGPQGPPGPAGPPGPTGPGTGDMLASNNLSDLANAATALDNIGGLAKAGGTMTGALTLAADASAPLQPATKQQLDAAILNAGKRARVRAATTANITISTALNNGDALDGVTLATGDLVLVKNQSAQGENGIYVVGVTPARSGEFDTWAEFPGSLVAVAEGSTNADTVWICTSNDGGTLGTTAIVFSRIRIDIQIPVPVSQGGTGLTSPGASGNVLTSDGTGFVSSPAPAAPALTLLAVLTASASATLDDTTHITAAYDAYLIEFENVVPTTNNAKLQMAVTSNGGGAWNTMNAMSGLLFYVDSTGPTFTAIGTTTSAGRGISGTGVFANPNSTSDYKRIAGTAWNSTATAPGGGTYSLGNEYTSSTAAVNGVRFFFDAGSISTGKIRIYGMKTT